MDDDHDVLVVKPIAGEQSVTLDFWAVEDAIRLAQTTDLYWLVEARMYDADGHEYARSRSDHVALDLSGLADNDGDGVPDAYEDVLGSDPWAVDSDGDTIEDGQELLDGTDPTQADTDHDGLDDSVDGDPLNADALDFDVALGHFAAGDVATAHAVLEALPSLDDNGSALYAVTTLLTVLEDAKAVSSPLYPLLDSLGLQVVGDTMRNYDIWLHGTPDGDGEPDLMRMSGQRDAQLELLDRVLEARTILDGVDETAVAFALDMGDGMPTEVDGSDILAARAGLAAAETLIRFSLAYEFTPTERGPDFSPLNLQDLTLASDAATQLAAAKVALADAVAGIQAAVAAVQAETDDQGDDLLALDAETEGLWPYIQATIQGVGDSAAASGFFPIPVFEDRENGVLALTEDPGTGEITATQEVLVFQGYLSADLSVLFDQPFDGAQLAADFAGGLSSVAFSWWRYWDDWTGVEESGWDVHWQFAPTSYIAGFIGSVLEDVEFNDEIDQDSGFVDTGVEVYLRDASGALLVDPWDGGPGGLDQQDPAGADTFTYDELVALAMPEAAGSITVDGDDTDWGAAAGADLDGTAEVVSVMDGEFLYLLVRSSTIATASGLDLSVHFGALQPGMGWPNYLGSAHVSDGGDGMLTGPWWSSDRYVVEFAVADGFVEMQIPLCGLGGLGAASQVFVQSLNINSSAGSSWWGSWDSMGPSGQFDDGFWGYRVSYAEQTQACSAPWIYYPDSDGDGLNDNEDPWPYSWDGDGDGLDDWEEVSGQTRDGSATFPVTNPTAWDTDGDGYSDGAEVASGSDPTDFSSFPVLDTDGDGLSDDEETNVYGTSPTQWDTDGDGWSDGEEVGRGTNPLDPLASVANPNDQDGDGVVAWRDADDTDPLVGTDTIDPARWSNLEFGRAVENGELVSGVTRVGSNGSNWLTVADPASTNQIGATVTVDVAVAQGALPRARVGGYFYNDGSGVAGGSDGDIWATMELRPNAAGVLRPLMVVARCVNAACSDDGDFQVLFEDDQTFDGVLLGDPHTLSIEYLAAADQFRFEIDGSGYTYSIPVGAQEVSPPNTMMKGIGTRVNGIVSATDGGGVIARFDDVTVNGAPYDDFAATGIDGALWAPNLEFVRVRQAGELVSGVVAVGSGKTNGLNVIDPASVQSLSADVTVDQAMASGATLRARVGGGFYSDRTGGVRFEGVVLAELAWRWNEGATEPVAFYYVGRCEDAGCNTFTTFVSGDLGVVAPGVTYNMAVANTGTSFTFTLDGTAVAGPFDVASDAPRVAASTADYGGVATKISGAAGADFGSIWARFDNVYVNGVLYDDFN